MPLSWPRAIVGIATAGAGGYILYNGAFVAVASNSMPLEWSGVVVIVLGLISIFVP